MITITIASYGEKRRMNTQYDNYIQTSNYKNAKATKFWPDISSYSCSATKEYNKESQNKRTQVSTGVVSQALPKWMFMPVIPNHKLPHKYIITIKRRPSPQRKHLQDVRRTQIIKGN